MTRFYDLNWSVKRKWQVEHIVLLEALRTLQKLRDLRLRNAPLVEIEAKLEEISDLINFRECFRGPLKTLWRATCGPRAANCPPLSYSTSLKPLGNTRPRIDLKTNQHWSGRTYHQTVGWYRARKWVKSALRRRCCTINVSEQSMGSTQSESYYTTLIC